ncbi:MAG: uracil-DNA glycosylase family protein [Rhodospirillales bacterium]|nr:uracil-DNA glycosylase family protein [Rhodospirillales bacterium]MDE2239515.1 uracil-DNA glycosylase family protein [Rhodospirillales bacterium]
MPLGARPVVQLSTTARLLIISQAPGTKVHLSGLPFDDASGDRLRGWMGIGRDVFYNAAKLNIMGMGFCYPGRLPNGGDAPPRPECAPLWHDKLLALMPQIELILLVGGYAQRRYLGKGSMTEMVRAQEHGGRFMPLPHPSWRTTAWERKNPWFAEEVLPRLQAEVARLTA